MANIRVSIDFSFEMAHALWNYDGLCCNLHGHSYKLTVTVIGKPISDPDNPKLGMVIDFGDLKEVVNTKVISRFEHSIVINKKAPHDKLKEVTQMFNRIVITDYQPTCENMVADIAQHIKDDMPHGVSLYAVKLCETATSYAEWFAADNQ